MFSLWSVSELGPVPYSDTNEIVVVRNSRCFPFPFPREFRRIRNLQRTTSCWRVSRRGLVVCHGTDSEPVQPLVNGFEKKGRGVK